MVSPVCAPPKSIFLASSAISAVRSLSTSASALSSKAFFAILRRSDSILSRLSVGTPNSSSLGSSAGSDGVNISSLPELPLSPPLPEDSSSLSSTLSPSDSSLSSDFLSPPEPSEPSSLSDSSPDSSSLFPFEELFSEGSPSSEGRGVVRRIESVLSLSSDSSPSSDFALRTAEPFVLPFPLLDVILLFLSEEASSGFSSKAAL